jgi:uncharacterized repeat protein (TIGR01451 family)
MNPLEESMKSLTRMSVFGLLLATSLSAPAFAQKPAASTPAALVVSAENRTAIASKDARHNDATAHAGDVLRYKLTFTNIAGRPVRQVSLQNPMASGLEFVAGSAKVSRADAQAQYTVDGGKSWSAHPMEMVMVDGKSVQRAVAPERYSGVRWIVSGFVASGATVTAEFEARVASRAASPAAVVAPAQR